MSVVIQKYSEGYVICKNIRHFCEYRGYNIKNYEKPSEKDLYDTGKYEVMCEHGGNPIRVVYIAHKSKHSKAENISTMLSDGVETIIIKNPSIKKINTRKITSPTKLTIIDGSNLFVNYTKFMRAHDYQVEIATQAEIDHIMNLYKIPQKSCFPGILDTSMEVVWLGASLGDIIYLSYPTIASSERSSSYRIVCKPVILVEDEEEAGVEADD